MGFSYLKEIAGFYQSYNLAETPIAVIQSGSTTNECIAVGTMESILDTVKELQLCAPALIVIGKVVSLHPLFKQIPVYA
jgi:uroporphyrin-III C-methyltransferase